MYPDADGGVFFAGLRVLDRDRVRFGVDLGVLLGDVLRGDFAGGADPI